MEARLMTEPIEVPENLDEDATTAFIIRTITDLGGNPDTIRVISVDFPGANFAADAGRPFVIDWNLSDER